MSAAVALVSPSSTRRIEVAYTAALLLGEIVIWIILAKLIPRVVAYDAGETLSVWAVAGTVLLGFSVSRWLGSRERSTRRRFWLGLLTTLIALQIIGSADLSESARVWNMSWLLELGRPSSPVWREAIVLADGRTVPGEIDQLFAAMMLIPIWFRGVSLGSADLMERSFSNYAVWGLIVIAISLALADNGGVVDHVRGLGILWVLVGLLTVVLKNAASTDQVEWLGAVQTGASVAATMIALVVGVALFLLVVTGVVAAIAGTGVVEPVLDAIGTVIRAIITVVSYILWPLFWVFEQIRDAIGTPSQETIERLSEGVGRPAEPIEQRTSDPDPTPGIVLSRVFGGIAAVLVFAIAAFYFFRRFVNRETRTEEVRESLWSEADLLDDLFGGLRGLGDRFRRRGPDRPPDAPIAELYYEVLNHAEGKGQIRALHRTPLQFADALERAYHSATPKRISEAFSTFRYGGHQPNQAELNSMRQSWDALKDN
ncbi:MAG: DUF4129 domain-containing protein [Chloroflexi bacterium]|nr:DUF4129 domain-containing protein [Chloroflexota bacterium]MYD16351.1 DUF4129 domain-containing protein [Chloroflexota bacterium]MYJ01833.1 DUF4129 domain-containing protein [Chloroflexota bacterium]